MPSDLILLAGQDASAPGGERAVYAADSVGASLNPYQHAAIDFRL